MSKRTNKQTQRRQVRRALNRSTLVRIGSHKAHAIGYGTGLTSRVVRSERNIELD